MPETAGVVVVAVCPTCDEPRYRSKFPFKSPDDARSENFEPVGDTPPAVGEAPPVCHVCQSMLSFKSAGSSAEPESAPRPRPGRPVEKTAAAPSSPRRISTIFETAEGETILDVRGSVVITNKRIVEVK